MLLNHVLPSWLLAILLILLLFFLVVQAIGKVGPGRLTEVARVAASLSFRETCMPKIKEMVVGVCTQCLAGPHM